MPAAPRPPRWFVDENSLGVAKALDYVRGDVTWPGAPDGTVPAGAADTTWLPTSAVASGGTARRLVRPDGHLAWRCTAAPADPAAALDLALGRAPAVSARAG